MKSHVNITVTIDKLIWETRSTNTTKNHLIISATFKNLRIPPAWVSELNHIKIILIKTFKNVSGKINSPGKERQNSPPFSS